MKGQKLTRNQLWCEAVKHVHLQFDVANLADEKSPLSVGKTFEHLWNLRAELRPREKRSHGVCIETQGLPGRFCTWGKTIAKHSQQRLKNLVVLSFLMLFFCWMTLLKERISLDSMDFCMFLSKGNAIEMHHTGVSAIFLLGSKSLSRFSTSSILYNNKAFSRIWIQNFYMKLSSTYTSLRSTWIQLIFEWPWGLGCCNQGARNPLRPAWLEEPK